MKTAHINRFENGFPSQCSFVANATFLTPMQQAAQPKRYALKDKNHR